MDNVKQAKIEEIKVNCPQCKRELQYYHHSEGKGYQFFCRNCVGYITITDNEALALLKQEQPESIGVPAETTVKQTIIMPPKKPSDSEQGEFTKKVCLYMQLQTQAIKGELQDIIKPMPDEIIKDLSSYLAEACDIINRLAAAKEIDNSAIIEFAKINDRQQQQIQQLEAGLATYKNTVTEFEVGNKPDIEFKCEAAVWMKNGNGSICYTGSLERAEFIANRLNAYSKLQAELEQAKKKE